MPLVRGAGDVQDVEALARGSLATRLCRSVGVVIMIARVLSWVRPLGRGTARTGRWRAIRRAMAIACLRCQNRSPLAQAAPVQARDPRSQSTPAPDVQHA
ncbi:MAG: hypothetical protein HC806_06850 [Anaerolineae bacterium]|nr:hypothetical protein [Anaerolineae bacterium]